MPGPFRLAGAGPTERCPEPGPIDHQGNHWSFDKATLGRAMPHKPRIWALGAGSAAGLLRRSARARRAERLAGGGILIGLGVLATLAHPVRHD